MPRIMLRWWRLELATDIHEQPILAIIARMPDPSAHRVSFAPSGIPRCNARHLLGRASEVWP
jgi:hypothetical protein